MILTCNHCYSVDYHRLDLKTKEVVCLKCGKNIKTTRVAKQVLKDSKQVVETVRSENEMTCEECGATAPPIIKKYSATDYKVVCSVCGAVSQRQTRFFADVWRKRHGIKVEMATPEEKQKSSEPMRFNKVKTQELAEAPVEKQEVSEVAPEPQIHSQSESKEHELVKYSEAEDVRVVEPEGATKSEKQSKVDPVVEEKARKRAEALLNTTPVIGTRPPVAKNITEHDIVSSGLSDYLGSSDE